MASTLRADDMLTATPASITGALYDRPSSPDRQRGSPRQSSPSPMNRSSIRLEFGSPGGRRQIIIGGPNTLGRREGSQPDITGGPNTLGRREGSQPGEGSSGTPGSSPPRLSECAYLRLVFSARYS